MIIKNSVCKRWYVSCNAEILIKDYSPCPNGRVLRGDATLIAVLCNTKQTESEQARDNEYRSIKVSNEEVFHSYTQTYTYTPHTQTLMQ